MQGIRRVFIANRGEIAVRIIKACREMGLGTVLGVSTADRDSLPARLAERSVCLGPHQPAASYLRVGTLITAARCTGCDALHPGYGFLAEQPELARACRDNGLRFIGPKPGHIAAMGDKLLARRTARELGIPLIPGSDIVQEIAEAQAAAESAGFPVLLKAAGGGGGKGMKIVRGRAQLTTMFNEAKAEARAAFNDDRLYLEKVIENARHIEVQILADSQGNALHLFERDCSVQRRYQKVIEEAPSPVVSPELRAGICEAALSIARHIGYESAGTVEFVLDQDEQKFYFLEMNTRIQVEHPVTEAVTGVDLVQQQIRIAAGEPLAIRQEDIALSGHALECRVTAELATDGFRPSPGRISQWAAPQGEGTRVDTHCFQGYLVPPFYDSLLAKVITWGPDRAQALGRMTRALDNFQVRGIDTTVAFLGSVLGHADFAGGRINTRWLENIMLS
ncbi:MAG: acetyl-CoA carboxylase biotin carboxylase subunit [Deltaproteobacteria bacterium]|nr:acetyl-CoA carboxylase biotin carboxylase subunit [Deltaproteobacteria bacterium]